jgi:predicted transcriptional regulator
VSTYTHARAHWNNPDRWKRRAFNLLRTAKMDTHEIAVRLGRTEAEVYNAIDHIGRVDHFARYRARKLVEKVDA